jgi:8-oxo-dGTP diphosphatase
VTRDSLTLDPMDVARQVSAALNASDADRLAALCAPDCVAEQVFVRDPGVHEGRETLRACWTAEFARYAGALEGGRRIDVHRVAGLQTGWGWVRTDWDGAVVDLSTGERIVSAGYSHFWIEHGLVRRYRTVLHPAGQGAPRESGHAASKSNGSHKRPVMGVGAVVLFGDGRVVLVKRRHEPLAGQWSLPGGGLELGETLEAGAAREILEETGLVVEVGPLIEVFDRILVDDAGAVVYHFVLADYLCRPIGGELSAASDVSDVALVALAELEEYRVTAKVRDVVAKALRHNTVA